MTPPVSPAVRRNTWLLAAGHGLLSGQLPVHMILGGLAGTMLAGQPEYGTLPITSMVLGTMCVTAPLSIFMQRFGPDARAFFSAPVRAHLAAWFVPTPYSSSHSQS